MHTGILFYKTQLSTSTLTQLSVIYINTTFSSIVFIAYQTSANKTSHCHCFWDLSHNHNILYNIVSFQSSPVQIFKIVFTSSAHIQLFNFDFTFIWSNTHSISALECGIGCKICVEQFFLWDFSNGISIQAYFSSICYCVSNNSGKIIKFCHYYSIYSMNSLSSPSIPNLSKN